ncbi:hypothetical protein IJ732_01415 [bacterium]|nr:hypothetical protein [bacterium]
MKEIFKIFWQSLKLYSGNFTSFLRYMAFPVFGQVLGLLWIIGISFAYITYLPKMLQNNLMNNFSIIFLILLLITLPGFFVMLKAFWEYLVAYGAINSMLDGLIKSGRIYDFPAHNEVITRKTAKFIGVWFVISILTLIALIPIFWIFGAILFVYWILVFQVFVFEPDEGVIGCFKRSFQIIKGKFGQTFLLLLLIGLFTNWFLPFICEQFLSITKILGYLAIPFDSVTVLLPLSEINRKIPTEINSLMLAKQIVLSFANFIILGLTLPMRSICWGLWYKKNVKAKSKIDKRLLQRAEEK